MKKLNDYLYSGDTVLKIIQSYANDLREAAIDHDNHIDLLHCNFLLQIAELLQHREFLSSQSQRIREFYQMMAKDYPFLAFTFKGRIKSLIRAENKFNGNIVEYIYNYYQEHKTYPSLLELKNNLSFFRDLIAYRIVISLPKCNLQAGQTIDEEENKYLYDVANKLLPFLEERGFTAELSSFEGVNQSALLNEEVRPYVKDYVANPESSGYQSLHITFYDNISRSFIEVQMRTKKMDDFAEIGPANHLGYEKRQERERVKRQAIPLGENRYFDDAFERVKSLQEIELANLDVNMFSAMDNSLINDGCGLYRGRLILPFEHLSKFENIDDK